MQDGAIQAEEAGAWLREHKPQVSIRWDVNDEHDQDAYERLLKLLFSPRAGSGAS